MPMKFISKITRMLYQKIFIRSLLVFSVLILAIFIYVSSWQVSFFHHIAFFYIKPDYLINTSKCVIHNKNPFNKDVVKFFHRFDDIDISKLPELSFIIKNESQVFLNLNETLYQEYGILRCCYSKVTRQDDFHIRISDCILFRTSKLIEECVVIVKCYGSMPSAKYEKVYAILKNEQIPARKQEFWKQPNKAKPFNVIILGIDSMSKLNLIRAMPKTYNFLEEHFINLKGYSRVGENTFPNLMPLLLGRTKEGTYKHCEPKKYPMNNCGFIWDKFDEMNYVTAYGEDCYKIGTFTFDHHSGFSSPPTDLYFRPYVIATELFRPECSDVSEIIIDLVKNIFTEFDAYPKFGFFWISSINHDRLSIPMYVDKNMKIFLTEMYNHTSFNETVFIVMSDHGFRQGKYPDTKMGRFEQNLPFVYIHLPESLKNEYKEEMENLMINTRRLTTPFDMYMTLQHFLAFINESYEIQPSFGCPQARSLFDEIDENRTCSDACIPQSFCLCDDNR